MSNNSLIATYGLHKQEYPLLVERKVERNVPVKCIRAVRMILSYISRSQYRIEVKKALVDANWTERLTVLSDIPFTGIDYDTANRNHSRKDLLKVIAFQIGQTLALLNGKEVYTKVDIANEYSSLRQFLYREDEVDLNVLQEMMNIFLTQLNSQLGTVKQDGYIAEFAEYNMSINLKTEEIIYSSH